MRLKGEATSLIYDQQLASPGAAMPFSPSCLMQPRLVKTEATLDSLNYAYPCLSGLYSHHVVLEDDGYEAGQYYYGKLAGTAILGARRIKCSACIPRGILRSPKSARYVTFFSKRKLTV